MLTLSEKGVDMTFPIIIADTSEKLTFGRFKDKSIDFMLRSNPSYLSWAIRHKVLKLSDELEDEIQNKVNKFKRVRKTKTKIYDDEFYEEMGHDMGFEGMYYGVD